jgi:hypothetical protein
MAAANSAVTASAIDPKLVLPAAQYATLTAAFGADFERRNNLHRVGHDTIAYAAGNAVRIHSTSRLVSPRQRASGLVTGAQELGLRCMHG